MNLQILVCNMGFTLLILLRWGQVVVVCFVLLCVEVEGGGDRRITQTWHVLFVSRVYAFSFAS